MADLPQDADSGFRGGDDAESATGTPRWVKVFGVVAIISVLLLVAIHIAGGGLGGHMHTP